MVAQKFQMHQCLVNKDGILRFYFGFDFFFRFQFSPQYLATRYAF